LRSRRVCTRCDETTYAHQGGAINVRSTSANDLFECNTYLSCQSMHSSLPLVAVDDYVRVPCLQSCTSDEASTVCWISLQL
jgi:hypothetical protein